MGASIFFRGKNGGKTSEVISVETKSIEEAKQEQMSNLQMKDIQTLKVETESGETLLITRSEDGSKFYFTLVDENKTTEFSADKNRDTPIPKKGGEIMAFGKKYHIKKVYAKKQPI